MSELAPHGRAMRNAGGLPKRVVIVDDSATMRKWLRYHLDKDTRLTVVGEASDGHTARTVIKETRPDVITLDIEMPGMDGLEFLERLMRLRPLPVVMISSATRRGSDAAVQALSLGAVDCLLKPQSTSDPKIARDLTRRVFSAACSTVTRRQKAARREPSRAVRLAEETCPIILLGASTGGVNALETVLAGLDPGGPPVVVVQHMPGTYLVSFTKMLDRHLLQTVSMLRNGERLLAGSVYVAPSVSQQHAGITRVKDQWHSTLRPAQQPSRFYPSVNALFSSGQGYASDVIAGLLTGLGRDGATGLKKLRDAGARTIAQDQESSVVYGMPRAAFEIGAVEEQVALEKFGAALNGLVAQHQRRSSGAT